MLRRWVATAGLLAAACCSKDQVNHGGGGSGSAASPSLTVFALAEVRGQIGPCGCTSDPLGDIARTAQVIADARAKGPVLVLDAGSWEYSVAPIPDHLKVQEDLKADLLAKLYAGPLGVAATGLGPADLAAGPANVRLARTAVNVSDPALKLEGAKLVDIGGAKVGVFGVLAKGAVSGVVLSDPIAAGKAAVLDLRGKGAQVVIGMIQAPTKRDAADLARAIGGMDFVIGGLGASAPEPDRIEIEAEKLADGWLVIPADRGQVISRLDLVLRDGKGFADAVGAGEAAAKLPALDKEIAALDQDLAAFAKDPTADKAFVAQKQREHDQRVAERDQLRSSPLRAPASGSYFTLDQVVIRKTLACNLEVQKDVSAYNAAAGEANVKAAAGIPVEAPAKGAPSYVGNDACTDCHSDAADFWKKTVHAQAWQTLVDRGQQYDLECIGCHVTGWEKPGGSNLGHNEKLRDIQCETCHGPGSVHVAKGGEEKPAAVHRAPPADLCATQCHTHEHSDTFQYEAYLRDVTGPGHGADRRTQLGDGPTGHSLRQAALDKSGRMLGSGCTR
ncbi:MAG TPA: multiheme c-type cytochrome [Kofleriaceae bacterium]|jgi:hypothetical protein